MARRPPIVSVVALVSFALGWFVSSSLIHLSPSPNSLTSTSQSIIVSSAGIQCPVCKSCPNRPLTPCVSESSVAPYLLKKHAIVAEQLKAHMLRARSQFTEPSTDRVHPALIDLLPSESASILQKPVLPPVLQHGIRVASFNIRNFVEPWEIRKAAIARQLRATHADFIGLQELRVLPDQSMGQLEQLAQLLPEYRFTHFQAAQTLSGEIIEGLGILSKHPLEHIESLAINPHPQLSSDTNARVCLRVDLDIPKLGRVEVFVAHLSFDAGEQCRQIAQVSHWMESTWQSTRASQILLGDFNVYFDFEWSIDPLTARSRDAKDFLASPLNPCAAAYSQQFPFHLPEHSFIDAWLSFVAQLDRRESRDNPGITYPAMHNIATADSCRPDRILLRSDTLHVHHARRFGFLPFDDDGTELPPGRSGFFASDHLGVLVDFVAPQ
ncbi:hypothetical protein CAOG_00146 [Capsaspora owczarzaki ATCC 30864]|uniref:Endonuclease/exonuclease/phosphatase domain-containing protein n=1 Tax=Capsaspora owczarzaki (strain ATCC 30864) TaxID=595528 RepID=A0A0D2TZZ6_CAPO3|nr:hypothetical protein CAOG_00146 [Capsaspora owczarzaki ATCC 30864]KJE88496.1 hypothetical protein CAOG_000146 [Capsaspora owczarzaki ATCC 30864]|eukprot:XP_004365017.2 hypothetical protein CAOG_00146 [Capsaspora owczarzaki ATCC 30864]